MDTNEISTHDLIEKIVPAERKSTEVCKEAMGKSSMTNPDDSRYLHTIEEWEQIFHHSRDGNAAGQNEAYHEIYRYSEKQNWHHSDGTYCNAAERQEAEQIFVIKMYQALRKGGSYEFQGTPLKYMQKVAQSVQSGIYKEDKRKIKKYPFNEDKLGDEASDDDLRLAQQMRDAMVMLSPDIQEEADKADWRARIREILKRCLRRLTPQQREFLILCLRLDTGNITEIGRLMGVKKTQAHRLWKEVKDRLRRCPELNELWMEQ
jgi:DNA-directed RNA polymerase specialized sigma24 family protein